MRENVSIDDIPVDIATTQSDTVELDDVPEEIESITRGLASEHPLTNPIVVLKAARWWYLHGKGGTDPAFGGQRGLLGLFYVRSDDDPETIELHPKDTPLRTSVKKSLKTLTTGTESERRSVR